MKDDPGASGRSLAKRAKGYLSSEDSVARREHVESLPSQGELMRATSYAPDIWASSVAMLGSDTLPHNCNLARWRGGSVSEECRLCGSRQTLLHVLNNCKVALHLRRYNQWHGRVLSVVAEMVQTHLPEGYQLLADVIWSDKEKALHLVELTICYETGFVAAERRKTARYAELVAEAQEAGYKSTLTPLQVGSRGALEERGPISLHSIVPEASSRQWKAFLTKLTTSVMKESFKIWCKKNTST
jgi:hypothetical protein